MSTPSIAYSFAVLRAVPHPYDGAFVPVGVVVHARQEGFLESRIITDPEVLRARVDGVDVELLARYLRSCERILAGDENYGPVALQPTSERFHWISAPRSDVVQSSPVHAGLCTDPAAALDELFECYVDRRSSR